MNNVNELEESGLFFFLLLLSVLGPAGLGVALIYLPLCEADTCEGWPSPGSVDPALQSAQPLIYRGKRE